MAYVNDCFCKGDCEATGVKLEVAASVRAENFQILKVLGKGNFGKVFLVQKIYGSDRGKIYAMKVQWKAHVLQKKRLENIWTERHVLEDVQQLPFLIHLHYAFQADTKLYLIMDFVHGGELFTHLSARDAFSELEARIYIGEIILGVEQLHNLGIMYRDLKLENVLLDKDGHIILTDFGLSKKVGSRVRRTFSKCGTTEYMAPEVCDRGYGHGMAVDWWSMGILAHELMTGIAPFFEEDNNSDRSTTKRILEAEPQISSNISEEAQDFIRRLLNKDFRKRLGGGSEDANELKCHPFFKDLNWEDLACKNIPAPFVPIIKGELDVNNFSEDFTSMPLEDSEDTLTTNSEVMYKKYAYVAPSLRGSENIPTVKQIRDIKFKTSQFFIQYNIDTNKKLGDGASSVCWQCKHKRTGIEYAVKIFSKEIDCKREIKLLCIVQNHPNIVQIHGVLDDEFHTYIIMELLKGGELLERIRKKSKFTEPEASRIMRKLVSAVQFMHQNDIVHRDLKSENIMFKNTSDNANIKVIDFGFAQQNAKNHPAMRTPCFTLDYAAPEILQCATNQNSEGYSKACDMWSLGVILYAMLSGRLPFHTHCYANREEIIMRKIMEGDFSFAGPEWNVVSAEAKQLIRGLLTVEPTKRLNVEDLSTNEWIQDMKSSK